MDANELNSDSQVSKAPHSYKDGVRVEIGCEEAQELIDHLQETVATMPKSLAALKALRAIAAEDSMNGYIMQQIAKEALRG